VKAGELRHRVKIQSRGTSQDTFGQQVETWSDLITVFAAIEPLNGRELFAAQAAQREVTTRITIRYNPAVITPSVGVVSGLRAVSDEGGFYDIKTVIDVEMRHREMQLMCAIGLADH
jgi:SPP1 family predicted phage head-tail adaptor